MAYQEMDKGAKSWLYKYVSKNHWRVAAWIDYDDLMQEGAFAWYDTQRRYPTAVTPQHIMALFKLVLRSNVEDIVRKNTKQVDDARSDIVETYESPAMIVPDLSNLHALLIKAPGLIKEALQLLTDDKMREELCKPFTRYDSGRRETLNDRFCQLLGKDSKKVDVVTQLRSYFAAA